MPIQQPIRPRKVEKKEETTPYSRVALKLDELITQKQLFLKDELKIYKQVKDLWGDPRKNENEQNLALLQDQLILSGMPLPQRLTDAVLKFQYRPSYAKWTQQALTEALNIKKRSEILTLLSDCRYSREEKEKVLKPLTDQQLWRLFLKCPTDGEVAKSIVCALRSPTMKFELFKRFGASIQTSLSEEEFGVFLKKPSLQFETIRIEIMRVLSKEGMAQELCELIDSGFVNLDNNANYFSEFPTDESILTLARRATTIDIIKEAFKFCTDKESFDEIIKDKAASFQCLELRDHIVKLAQEFSYLLGQEPDFRQLDELRGSNKFVVGLPTNGSCIIIAWSNTGSYQYHRDLFRSLENWPLIFPEELRSGGSIDIKYDSVTGAPTKVIFSGSSGDFGRFNVRLITKLIPRLQTWFAQEFGVETIEVEIK